MMFLRSNCVIVVVAMTAFLQLFSFESCLVRGEEDQPPTTAEDFRDEPDVSKPDGDSNITESESGEVAELRSSPWAETSLVFVQPPAAIALPGGKEVKLIVGLYNNGDQDFIVDRIEASLHYPLDYSYHIQNFTTIQYGDYRVSPKQDASFEYSFLPSDMLSSRTLGLSISLFYSDTDGKQWRSTVHNSTMDIYEPQDGLDGETFFLYVTMTAFAVLGAVGGYHYIVTSSIRRLKAATSRVRVETGTQNNKSDIDYDWLPEDTLQSINKSSPKTRTSPRLRAAASKRRSGGADN